MTGTTAEAYRRFALHEAQGQSPLFQEWANSIADDPVTLALLDGLPDHKRQPNLVFAAARLRGAPLAPYATFQSWLRAHWDDIVPVILSRSTQTNEARRCAVLLPALSRISGPVALIEAGASAGLCLYPDKYSYDYRSTEGITTLHPAAGPSAVTLNCTIDADSVPRRLPEVVFRAGVDTNPLKVRDPDDLQWLETLIWPEHDSRRARLRQAAAIAAAEPARLVQGDLIESMADLVAQAPAGAHVVVFHSSVLVYLTPERCRLFVELMSTFPHVTWISNEAAHVFPEITGHLSPRAQGHTVLAVDGEAQALVGPHGQHYRRL